MKTTQEFDFETWYEIALQAYHKKAFKGGLPLDKDAALYAYKDGFSPEAHIQMLWEESDSDC